MIFKGRNCSLIDKKGQLIVIATMTQNRTFSIIMPLWRKSVTTPLTKLEKPAAEKIQKVSLFAKQQ